ncbi:MAG: M48 family metallopeptidase [Mollicutes bacterium]|nr:M48 family metallopeptidase [Mollicutes bacterium]
MEVELLGEKYKVKIEKKHNKHTYIRVKPDLTILVTTNFLTTKKSVKELLSKHEDFLIRSIQKRKREIEREKNFYYLGKKYDIIIFPQIKSVEINDDKIYTPSMEKFKKWYKNQMREIFNKRLIYNHQLFEEKIPFPELKIRKMKTRWGVCNSTKNIITLNSELIKFELEVIDYVIIHELAHFLHPNHSSDFWKVVFKYSPNYKKIRKYMRG